MFLVLVFISIFSNAISVSGDRLDKYLEYLHSRGVIDESNISFAKNSSLNKEDIFFYLYKIFKNLDINKASNVDLNIIEQMVADLSEYVNKIKFKSKEQEKNFTEMKKDLEDLKSLLESNRAEREQLEDSLEILKNKFIESIDEDSNRLRYFIKSNVVRVDASYFHFLKDIKLNEHSYSIDLSFENKFGKLSLKRDMFLKDVLNLNYKFSSDKFKVTFNSSNLKKAFRSSTRDIFFTTLTKNNDYKGASIFFDRDDLKLFLISSELDSSVVSRISFQHIDISLYLSLYRRDNYFKSTLKLPFLDRYHFGVGAGVKRSSLDAIVLFFDYYTDSLDFNLTYNFRGLEDDRLRKIVPSLIYKIGNSIKIDLILFFDLIKDNDTLDKWNINLKYSIEDFNLDILSGKDENMFIGAKVLFNSDFLSFSKSFIYKSNRDFAISLGMNFKVPDSFMDIFFKYIYSNFDFEDNYSNLSGEEISLFFDESTLSKSNNFSVGIRLNI